MPSYKVEFTLSERPLLETSKPIMAEVSPHFERLIDAENRADAYIKFCRHAAQEGYDVTIIPVINQEAHTLGFSSDEIANIRQAGVPFGFDSIQSGYVIEKLDEKETGD